MNFLDTPCVVGRALHVVLRAFPAFERGLWYQNDYEVALAGDSFLSESQSTMLSRCVCQQLGLVS